MEQEIDPCLHCLLPDCDESDDRCQYKKEIYQEASYRQRRTEIEKKSRAKRPDHYKAYAADYREKNREELRGYIKKNREDESYKEKERLAVKNYYEKNKEKIQTKNRKRRQMARQKKEEE